MSHFDVILAPAYGGGERGKRGQIKDIVKVAMENYWLKHPLEPTPSPSTVPVVHDPVTDLSPLPPASVTNAPMVAEEMAREVERVTREGEAPEGRHDPIFTIPTAHPLRGERRETMVICDLFDEIIDTVCVIAASRGGKENRICKVCGLCVRGEGRDR